MSESAYWLRIWKCAAIFICIITVSLIGSCQSTKYQIRKGVEAGATPVEMACAYQIGVSSAGEALCAMELIKD